MPYDYVRRAYGVDPQIGQPVKLENSSKVGTVAREDLSMAHYVMVRFDGQRHASPCHPTSLEYLPMPPRPARSEMRPITADEIPF